MFDLTIELNFNFAKNVSWLVEDNTDDISLNLADSPIEDLLESVS